jgi:hypothetical protein
VILLIILGFIGSLVYALYRATRKWGIAVLYFAAAAVALLDAGGILAERLWGPQWSWNFSHRDAGSTTRAVTQGIFNLFLGFWFRAVTLTQQGK